MSSIPLVLSQSSGDTLLAESESGKVDQALSEEEEIRVRLPEDGTSSRSSDSGSVFSPEMFQSTERVDRCESLASGGSDESRNVVACSVTQVRLILSVFACLLDS